ncbi:C4-dicarboxylate ABC transporter substrate-binding protein [Acuticoccus sediminis]|uniref:C4-dicarboxylate ABC transporter substrate-binding protein n=1 Tax=Acuticoccus sediminis TaxID=2184697 RepID=A0A8B2P1K1_9HYPH|nr:TRAP transporter substrate-binding protein [Acuticoccus sediminis]RAI04345.1 C4-dicarboxylate ABC transporter substrate-binding protein [Acuticoccus sediminis]
MIRSMLAGVALASLVASGALAQEFTLRIQTHHSPESISGVAIAQFYDDIETMSGGRIAVEPFFSSAVVKSPETFDAVINGILDGDMTSGAYQTGKDTAFQFIGDPMGGYDTPWQMYAWLYEGGGLDAAQKIYNGLGMQLIGWHIAAPESLASTQPIGNPDDLKGWKFRSPPGMETQIFANMGASPIVMDFTEVFTSLESGIIAGADMSNLAVNKSAGLYDIAKHASFPGFHSMPADHFAIRKDMWDSMPEDLQRIIDVAMQKMSFRLTLSGSVATEEAAQALLAEGVTIHDWSPEDRRTFREASLKAWDEFADTDAARELIQMHKDFQKNIGLSDER